MMLKRASIAVLVLVAAVFLYIGYSSYDAGRSSATAGVQAATRSKAAEGPISTTASETAAGEPLTAAPAATGEVTASGSAMTSGGAEAPATDTIKPNPPNGMTFGGSGHYQLYRQGNLTWRLNTDTGQSCIVFATEEEWRKPQVFRNGCKTKG